MRQKDLLSDTVSDYLLLMGSLFLTKSLFAKEAYPLLSDVYIAVSALALVATTIYAISAKKPKEPNHGHLYASLFFGLLTLLLFRNKVIFSISLDIIVIAFLELLSVSFALWGIIPKFAKDNEKK